MPSPGGREGGRCLPPYLRQADRVSLASVLVVVVVSLTCGACRPRLASSVRAVWGSGPSRSRTMASARCTSSTTRTWLPPPPAVSSSDKTTCRDHDHDDDGRTSGQPRAGVSAAAVRRGGRWRGRYYLPWRCCRAWRRPPAAHGPAAAAADGPRPGPDGPPGGAASYRASPDSPTMGPRWCRGAARGRRGHGESRWPGCAARRASRAAEEDQQVKEEERPPGG